MRPFVAGGLLSLAVGFILYRYFVPGSTLGWWVLSAFVSAQLLGWILSFWNIRHRLLKRTGMAIHVRMTDADFSIAYKGEAHTLPWARFKFALVDDFNLYLFVNKAAALIVPLRDLPASARELAVTRVRNHATAI
jgi:hypothetical protein